MRCELTFNTEDNDGGLPKSMMKRIVLDYVLSSNGSTENVQTT